MSLSFGNLPFGADLGVPPAVSTVTFDLSQAAYEGQFADVMGAHLLRQLVAADSVVRLRVTGTELKVSLNASLAGYVEFSLDGGTTYADPTGMVIGSDSIYTVYTGLSDVARDVVIRAKFSGPFYLDARPDSTFIVTGAAPACVPDPTAAGYTQYVLNATATDPIGRAGILNGVRLEEGYAAGTVSNPMYTAVQVGVTALGSDGLATNYLIPCQVRLSANVTDIALWTYLDGQAKFALITDEVIGASVTVPNTGHWGRFTLATGLSGTHTYGLCCAYMAPTNYGFGSGAIYSIHTKGGTGIDTTSRPAARPKLVLPGDSIWGNQVSLDAASTVNDGTLKWALPLAERLHMEFVNLGIGSTTLRDFSGDVGGGGVGVPYNTTWSGEARITHDLTGLSLPAGSMVLVGGWTNDYGQAFYQSGAGVPLETEAQYRGACDRFLTRLLAVVGTGVPVYWAGITPRSSATFVGFTPQPRSEWNQQQIDAIAANGAPNVAYIETADANLAGPTETDFTTNFMDGLHWNQAGCAVMVDFFYSILAGSGTPTPTPTPTPTVSTFIKGVNFNDTLPPIVLAVPHTAGAPTLVLPAGAGARLGTLPANRFFRVTALRNPGTATEVVLGIYKATGIDIPGDTLTGVTGAEGFANVAQSAGVTIEVRDTAQDYEDHSSAINAAEVTLATHTTTLADHVADTANPHATTKAQVGLGSVDNTSDAAKPVSTAAASALAGKQPLDAVLTAIADDDGFTYDPVTHTLTTAGELRTNTAPGSLPVTIGGFFGDLNTATIWFADVPNGANYTLRGNRGGGTWLNAAVLIQIRIADTDRVDIRSDRITWNGPQDFNNFANSNHALAIDTEASVDLDGTRRNVEVVATRADARPLVVIGAPSQSAPLVPLRGISSTSARRDLGYLDAGFVVATDASYTGYVDLDAVDFAGRRKGLRVSSDGTRALIGAYGVTPVAQPSGDVATGLAALGWMTAPTYAASGITGSIPESQVTGLVADLAAKAPLASPALTGTPTAPTAAVDTSTTQVATTAFVLGQAAAATPLIDGTAAAGTSTRYARGDHVHPTDTTRAPLASPALTGTPTAPTAAFGTTTTQLATTAFVAANTDVNGRLTATVTTTSSTLGTNALTNLGFAIGASEVWTVEWNLTVTGSTAGMKFDVTGPASPTDLRISILGNTSAITAISAETITAFSTASAAYVLYATTSGQVRIVACISNGANAGTVQLRFGAATNTQSNSVLLNSYMTARRIG